MHRLVAISVTAAALAVAVFFSVLTWQIPTLVLHLNGVLTRAEGVESKLNATAANLDKATGAWAASAKTQAGAIEDLATDAHGTLWQVNNLASSMTKSADALHENLNALHKTADAATGLATQARVDLETLNGSISQAGPLLSHTDATVGDLDALLKRKAITDSLDSADELLAHSAAITGDLARVTKKAADDFTAKKPWYRKIGGYAGDTFDLAAFLARHY